MGKALTKIVYKPDTQSTDEFIVIVNPAEYQRWKGGETSLPLTEVVDSFKVFFSNQGSQGLLGQPSRQQLENVFGTSKDVDVLEHILKNGKAEASDGFNTGTGIAATNATKGSFAVDTKGKATSGINGGR